MKQIIQIEHNKLRNPNWLFHKRVAKDMNSTSVENKSMQLAVRAGLELMASGLKFQHTNRSSTLPPDGSSHSDPGSNRRLEERKGRQRFSTLGL